jgi:hypothetical protein
MDVENGSRSECRNAEKVLFDTYSGFGRRAPHAEATREMRWLSVSDAKEVGMLTPQKGELDSVRL